MRKNGTSILQSFLEGQSLLAPQHVASLRALVEYQQADSGVLGNLMRTLGPLMGRGDAQAQRREDINSLNDSMCATMGLDVTDRNKPFAFSDGIAVIPVYGSLLHRDAYSDSYATGYDFIRSRFQSAMADPDVSHIVFDVNSGGGHVAGNFELCEEIYAGRSIKPSLAIVDSAGYSGAYSIGSSASQMVAAPSAGVGSIGVLTMHVSVEEFLKKQGIDVSMIFAGAHKVDSYPFNDLSEAARARFQASVDKSYEKFVSLVARNRGMDAKAVRATEALCYDAEEALTLGMIDAISVPSAALAAFRLGLTGSITNPQQGASTMSTTTAAAAPAAAATDTPVVAAPVAAAPAVVETAPAVTQSPASAERARVKGITMSEHAKGREALASHFAYETDMSVEAACSALAAAPVAAAAPAATPFAAAMDNTANPNVGAAAGGAEDGGNAKVSVGDRIANNYAGVTGMKLRDK